MKNSVKKLTLIACLSILSIAFIVVAVKFVVYYTGTISKSEIVSECISSSQTKADSFALFYEPSHPRYAFLVAENGSSDELFVYEEEQFLFFKIHNRFSLYNYNTSNNAETEEVGSSLLISKDKNGQFDSTKTMVYFSSNKNKISKCTYTLEINGTEKEVLEKIDPEKCFAVFIPSLGTLNGEKRAVKNVQFLDSSNRVVYSEQIAIGDTSYYPE